MTTIRATIARLRELYDKATPGRWVEGRLSVYIYDRFLCSDDEVPDTRFIQAGQEDAAFIAKAHNAMPALLDRLEKLERVAKAVRVRLEVWTRETYIDLEEALKDLEDEKR